MPTKDYKLKKPIQEGNKVKDLINKAEKNPVTIEGKPGTKWQDAFLQGIGWNEELPELVEMTPSVIENQNQLEYKQLIENNEFFRKRPQYHKVINRLITRGNSIANLLLSPTQTADDRTQRFHGEEQLARLSGYVTSWENLNSIDFPAEAFEAFDNPNFWKWWMHKPDGLHDNLKEGPSSVTSINNDGDTFLPELIYHGTLYAIDPKTGLIQTHPDMFDPGDWAQELGPHGGTQRASQEIVLENQRKKANRSGDPYILLSQLVQSKSLQDFEKLNIETTRSNISTLSGTETGRFYMGFMKVNNPLELPDLGIWNFKSVIEELDDTGELAKAQFTFASDSSLYKNTDYKGIKGLESEGYGGTSISRIAEYMHQMYDEDHPEDKGGLSYKQYSNRTGLDKISDEMDFGTRIAQEDYDIFTDDYLTLTDAYKNDVDYYKLRAVTRFIQDDLGYDGIKYLNKGEDIGSQAWIIFNPNQFKSIFNKGTYQWGDRKKPHKNYMTKRKPNKYQNRKAVA